MRVYLILNASEKSQSRALGISKYHRNSQIKCSTVSLGLALILVFGEDFIIRTYPCEFYMYMNFDL